MITLTAKIRILPSPEEADWLPATMRAYSAACNTVSRHIFQSRDLSFSSLNRKLYSSLRRQFALRSQMAQSVIKTVIARYRTILQNQKGWICPKFRRPEYDLVWNRDYSLTRERFSVNTLYGRIKLAFHREAMDRYFDGTWKFGTAKLVTKHGNWFLHIPMTADIPECPARISDTSSGWIWVSTFLPPLMTAAGKP